MIISKTVKVKITSQNKKNVYTRKGYEVEIGKEYDIPIEDISPYSYEKIECACDYCQKPFNIPYRNYTISINRGPIQKFSCFGCKGKKTKESNLLVYGVEAVSQIPEIREKAKETMIERYGVANASQSPEIRQKMEEANLKKWGVKNPAQTKEVQAKMRQTCIDRYGVPVATQSKEIYQKLIETNKSKYGYASVSQVPEIREKIKQTNLTKWRVENVSSSPEIQNKKFKTMNANNSCPTSTQQEYIAKLYNATSNVPFNKYLLDMVLEFDDLKLDIEVDGSGHMMCVYRGVDIKDFERKEIIRNNYVKQAGYKIVRIVSRKDRYPSDEKLLYMLEYAKNFFIENPERSWLTFDIDNSCIHNAYYKTSESGLPFNYGELRLIRNETDSEVSDSEVSGSEVSDFDILDSDISDNSTYIPLTSPNISPYILVS